MKPPHAPVAAFPEDTTLSRDRSRLLRLLGAWRKAPGSAPAQAAYEAALAESSAARHRRDAQAPTPTFDDSLPVAREAQTLVELIRRHPVVVVAGETGSGKTTQLPKLCLAAGRGRGGIIGCTQPRRIAARAVARRVAEELQTPVGGAVGFQVRFSDNVGDNTYIKFMTDGILLAEIQGDRWLSKYDTIILDEAHERSLNIDFLLGYLKQLVHKRADLKLVITSATIDTERFARHFDGAPVVSVEGRGFPVELRYRPPEAALDEDAEGASEPLSMTQAIVAAADEITRQDPLGDVLVFLPGEREIRDAHAALARRKYRATEVVPLYARLSVRDQDRVFNPGPGRRIVLATNVAETSLTVPRIRYVIDPGAARVKRYSPRSKLDRLHIEPISQASADQRKGRCGRIAAGICYRLYSEDDFNTRPRYTDPEILRASLAGVILRMLTLGLGNVEDFAFLDPPDARAVADGWQTLAELGAVDAGRRLTAIGRQMSRLPVDVKLARMLVAAQGHGVLAQMTVITSFLGIQDPRERPADAREKADLAHAQFADPQSEFIAILNLWEAYHSAHEELTQSKLRDWCERRFLGFLRMREWRELHRQLLLSCEELGWPQGQEQGQEQGQGQEQEQGQGQGQGQKRCQSELSGRQRASKQDIARITHSDTVSAPAPAPALAPAPQGRASLVNAMLHRALIAGLPTQVAHRGEKGLYDAPRQRKFQLFPGSSLAKLPPAWVLVATVIDTQKVWGMTAARIEPEWVMAELPHLLARKHFDPHWSRAQGRVIGSEQVSLFGLVLAPKRPVHYGGLYPVEAREIFVRQGLVPGAVDTRSPFLKRNLATLAQAHVEEAKLRRAGLVADEDWQARWYLDRLPAETNSVAALDSGYPKLAPEQRKALEWSLADLLPGEGSEAERFPKYFPLGDARLALHYRFEPGHADDGVTLDVPLHLLKALDPARLDWLVPGLVEEKATALIRGLPKAQRRNYVPAPDFARAFAQAYPKADADSLPGTLARFLTRATGAPVTALDFDGDALDPHLRMNLRLAGRDSQLLASTRHLAELHARFGEQAERAFAEQAGEQLAREGLLQFPTAALPRQIAGAAGVPAFPALVDQRTSVALSVFADADEAAREHDGGVRRLAALALAEKLKQARKQLPLAPKLALLYAAIEGFAQGGSAAPAHEQLRADLAQAALNAVLEGDFSEVRDAARFQHLVEDAGKRLFTEAMSRLQLAEAILGLVAQIKPQLESPLLGWASGNLDDLKAQLAGLVPPGFLRETPAQWLADYPRFLRALALRAERALRDPVRDQARMLELKPFTDAIAAARADGRLRRPDWQALRWDLEELRVSLFAQELGTRRQVSTKRLARQFETLT